MDAAVRKVCGKLLLQEGNKRSTFFIIKPLINALGSSPHTCNYSQRYALCWPLSRNIRHQATQQQMEAGFC